MRIQERKLKGALEVTLEPRRDERGFFMRTADREIFRRYGLDRDWVQENHSRSMQKGILRGLHFQFPPHAESKLVRCVRGAVLDVFVDLRKGSPTFGMWDSVELSEENDTMVFISRGFAHGYCTLTAVSDVLYKVDNRYAPEAEGGILWNDPDLAIRWPEENPVLSQKDRNNMTLVQFVEKFGALEIDLE